MIRNGGTKSVLDEIHYPKGLLGLPYNDWDDLNCGTARVIKTPLGLVPDVVAHANGITWTKDDTKGRNWARSEGYVCGFAHNQYNNELDFTKQFNSIPNGAALLQDYNTLSTNQRIVIMTNAYNPRSDAALLADIIEYELPGQPAPPNTVQSTEDYIKAQNNSSKLQAAWSQLPSECQTIVANQFWPPNPTPGTSWGQGSGDETQSEVLLGLIAAQQSQPQCNPSPAPGYGEVLVMLGAVGLLVYFILNN